MKRGTIIILAAIVIVIFVFTFLNLKPKSQENTNTPPMLTAESEMAAEALILFFDYLSQNEFEKALTLLSLEGPEDTWQWLANFSLPEDRDDQAKILENYCQATGTCLKAKVLSTQINENNEYDLVVQFINQDQSTFVFGPCCGESEETMPSKDKFDFKVKKINNKYMVLTPPLYRP